MHDCTLLPVSASAQRDDNDDVLPQHHLLELSSDGRLLVLESQQSLQGNVKLDSLLTTLHLVVPISDVDGLGLKLVLSDNCTLASSLARWDKPGGRGTTYP